MEKTLIQEVFEELKNQGYDATISTVNKNNQTMQALTVRLDGSNIAPTIYSEQIARMYTTPDMSIPELAQAVLDFTAEHMKDIPDISNMMNKDYVLSNARLSICNADWNTEMLESVIHERIDGTSLAVYPRITLSPDSSVKATKEYMETLGITEKEILTAARNNSHDSYTVRSMNEVMSELTGLPLESLPETNMTVISNTDSLYGASAISDKDTLEQARISCKADSIYIIPSSIHECLAVSTSDMKPEDLRQMIVDVNRSEVSVQDRLADDPMIYDGNKLTTVRIDTREQQRNVGRSR